MLYSNFDFYLLNPIFHGVQFHPLPLRYDLNVKKFTRIEEHKTFDEDIRFSIKKAIQLFNLPSSGLPNSRRPIRNISKFYWIENIDLINFDRYDYSDDFNYFNIIVEEFKKHNLDDKLFFLSNNIKKNAFSRVNHIPINTFLGVTKEYLISETLDIKRKHGFKYKFLFLNRKRKPHREKLLKFFKDQKLEEMSLMSKNFLLTNPNNYVPGDSKDTPYYFTGIELKEANKCFCNVVTETFFDLDLNIADNIFITEKIDRCFAQHTPFIVTGRPLYLKYLKEIGFKTFDKWWDESYDNIVDDNQRLYAIQQTIKTVSSWSLEKCHKVYLDMQDTLYSNYLLFQKIKKFRLKNDILPNTFKADYFNFCYFNDLINYIKNE